MEKIEYEKPELKELDTDRGEGYCVGGSGDSFCTGGNAAGDECNVGAAFQP